MLAIGSPGITSDSKRAIPINATPCCSHRMALQLSPAVGICSIDTCLILPVSIIALIAGWPRAVELAAINREPHRLAFYLYEVAAEFHSYYNKGKDQPQLRFILPNQVHLTQARLALLQMIRYTLVSGLNILGVKPIDEM